MTFTDRQHVLLGNLDRVTSRDKMSGKTGFFLANKDCTATIDLLMVKRVIVKMRDGKRRRLAGHMGRMSPGVFAIRHRVETRAIA